MAKPPSFQFYPGDWLRNDISGCSLEAQGLWLRMMIVMHDSEVYGELSVKGEPMPDEFVAKKCGISRRKLRVILEELDRFRVVNREKNGVIYSGRMRRDEQKRQQNAARQRKFYDGHKDEPNAHPNAKLTLPLHSSSSSSSSNIRKEEDKSAAAKPPTPPDEGDLRRHHPSIVAVQDVCRKYPPKEIWDDIIDQVGLDVDHIRMRKCFSTWVGRGFNKTNYDWLLDWYVQNRIPTAGGSNGKTNGYQPKRDTSTDRLRATAEIYDKYPTEAELGRKP